MKRNFKKWMLVGLCAMMSMQTSVAVLAEEMSLSEVQSNETVIVQGETAQWKKDETGWKYQRADGSYVANQWDQINGNWYHFDQNGYMETGWKKIEWKLVLFEVQWVNGNLLGESGFRLVLF